MKGRNYIYLLMWVLTTLLAWWVIPSLVKKMTDTSNGYPLMYYSARLKELCIIDFRNESDSFRDIRGNIYPRAAYDSLLPLLNARQLMLEGSLPDSLDGHVLEMKEMRVKQVMFRHRPADIQTVQPRMGVLFEAMPKRGNLVLPGDYFTLDDDISFFDAETNSRDDAKSERFNAELNKKGFTFPARRYWGNPSVRKPYEEGYFCLDASGKLFHLKMVNGRPFVKNTHIGDSIKVKWVVLNEAADKRHYAFVFGERGEAGIIEENGGGYLFRRMEIRPVNLEEDQLTVLGNLLYWTVTVTGQQGMDSYGLDRESLHCLSSYNQPRHRILWDEVSEWLFPAYLSFNEEDNDFINFYWHPTAWKALWIHTLLALCMAVWGVRRMGNRKKTWISVAGVWIGGIPAWIAWLILPEMKN